MTLREIKVEEYTLTSEPFYLPIRDEIEIFKAAFHSRTPVLLKGPTGTGKTRFIEYMAYILGRELRLSGKAEGPSLPLITVACHEDLTASDLVGKFLLKGEETIWVDGPLTKAVKTGAICYLDEIVEARKDTTVLIHPLTDHRRFLPVDKTGKVIEAHENFLLVISYNPGYQSLSKDLKHSTRQRFLAIEFGYPSRDQEMEIIQRESGLQKEMAADLTKIGEKVRNLKGRVLGEGVSTRLLIYAARLINQGVPPRRACEAAIGSSITDEPAIQKAVQEVISAVFPGD